MGTDSYWPKEHISTTWKIQLNDPDLCVAATWPNVKLIFNTVLTIFQAAMLRLGQYSYAIFLYKVSCCQFLI